MDKWTEGELKPYKKGGGFSRRSVFVFVLIAVFILVIFYLYTCTCFFGKTICHKNGARIDEYRPQTMELGFSFLNYPGRVTYPWGSLMLKEEGSVGITLQIDKEGIIISSELEATSGYPYLDKAALEAISTFSVNKEKINNEVGEERTIKITFKLPE